MFLIIQRFLFSEFFKVVSFCVAAFVTVLLVTRLDDIAHFISMEATANRLLFFILYQIPYILPIAVPISCLISSILLFRRLSKTHELTALRSCGWSLRKCLTPILLGAGLIAIFNFYAVSEIAPASHLATGKWKAELRMVNPLLLLRNKHLMRIKGGYFNALGPSKYGEWANNVIAVFPNRKKGGMNLFLAQKLRGSKEDLLAAGVSIISAEGDKEEGFDDLLIENIRKTSLSIPSFSNILRKGSFTPSLDHMRLEELLQKYRRDKTLLMESNLPADKVKSVEEEINRTVSEVLRRISIALAAFTFTLMGASFGISVGRGESSRSVFCVIALAALYLLAYFIGGSLDRHFLWPALFYLVPHLLLAALSILSLRRTSEGIER